MEALALVKQWRRRRVSTTTPTSDSTTRSNSNSATIADDDEESSTSAEDEGPFFDLEFEMPEEEECKQEEGREGKCGEVGGEDEEEEKEFIFPVSTGEDDADLSLQLSPSDDLFFKGRLEVPLTNNDEVCSFSSNSSLSTDVTKPLFLPISFLKSATATRLRVLVSGLKKPKSTNTGNEDQRRRNPKRQFLTVKFKVDDLRVPIVSLFSREATSRRTGTKPPLKDANIEPDSPETPTAEVVLTVEKDEEKRFARELVQKYLEKIRPLYMKVYKKHIAGVDNPPPTSPCVAAVVAEEESTSTSSETVESESESSPDEVVEEGSTSTPPPVVGRSAQKFAQVASHLPSGLKVAVKNLVRNTKPSFSPPATTASPTSVLVRRRDDSLLQQQDGIQSGKKNNRTTIVVLFRTTIVVRRPTVNSRQSAIAHCKQSLHSHGVLVPENPTTMTSSDVKVAEIKRNDDCDPTIDP